jgi:hypothetical protein
MGKNEFIQWSIVQRSFQELVEHGTDGFESNQELPPLYLYLLWGIRKIASITAINLPHIGSLYLSILRGMSDSLVVGSFAVLTQSYSVAVLLGLLLTLSPEYAAHGGVLGNLGLSITMMHLSIGLFLLVIRYRKNWLAMLAVFFSLAAVQIHSSCFFPAVSLLLLLLLMDFKNLTYQKLIQRSSSIIVSIFVLYIPYLFFNDPFVNEDAVSYEENMRRFFSFLTTEDWGIARSVQVVEKLVSFLGISTPLPLEGSTILTGLLLFVALLRASLYQDKIAQLFLYSLFSTLLVCSISGNFDTTHTLLHLLLPLFLFLLSLLMGVSTVSPLRLIWGLISILIFCFPFLYAKRKQKLTMPEYDIFRRVAMEVVEKGLLVKGFDGVESLQHAKPYHIGYMLAYLGGKLDPCAKETVIAREDGSFFLLEEKGPSFPQ